ncbi:MAG: hypothetical protein IJ729_06970 [Alloprevotella sp.]|nr:hypothetical protein [Alloprevotella sp.]
MEPWEERFINEYNELSNRADKLAKMLEKYQAGTLDFTPNCSYDLLHEQLVYMRQYLRVLRECAEIEKIDAENEGSADNG